MLWVHLDFFITFIYLNQTVEMIISKSLVRRVALLILECVKYTSTARYKIVYSILYWI